MRKNMLFEEREGSFWGSRSWRYITAELNVERYDLRKDGAIAFLIPTEHWRRLLEYSFSSFCYSADGTWAVFSSYFKMNKKLSTGKSDFASVIEKLAERQVS